MPMMRKQVYEAFGVIQSLHGTRQDTQYGQQHIAITMKLTDCTARGTLA